MVLGSDVGKDRKCITWVVCATKILKASSLRDFSFDLYNKNQLLAVISMTQQSTMHYTGYTTISSFYEKAFVLLTRYYYNRYDELLRNNKPRSNKFA